MENFEISKEKMIKIKDGIVFTLLFLWVAMPMFQTIKAIYKVIPLVDWYFILMKVTGVVGIALAIITIFFKIKNSENKKQTLKELIPIFLLVLYMIWTLISCLLSSNKYRAFNGSRYRREGYYMYLNYAGYFLCAFLLDSKRLRKILVNTFVIASVFLIAISRLSLLGEPFSEIFVNNTVETTVFAQFNHYGYYLMMTLMCSFGLLLAEKNTVLKILYGISSVIICYAMIYNDTFGCYLAVAVSSVIYLIYSLIKKKDRVLTAIAILVFVILSIFTTKDGRNLAKTNIEVFLDDVKAVVVKTTGFEEDNQEPGQENQITEAFMEAGTSRGRLWLHAFEFISKNPIIGYGADTLGEQYEKINIRWTDRPHNLYIYLACVSGVPGLLLYMTAVGIIIVKGIIKLFKNNGNEKIYLLVVVTYMISSMFGNSMFYTSPFFFIFLGSLMKCNLDKKEEKNLQNL